ncbi:MAG TPA: EndoU domain-containing protein [Candidatus Babeliales bacterium]|nr:EndoU domain-containing protein [Candidatus Babeliales bacterium]HLC07116.1 EndoU domain-containing protein [Candidatus Babeliales bacterium]
MGAFKNLIQRTFNTIMSLLGKKDDTIEYDSKDIYRGYKKIIGKAFFPAEWSRQEVIDKILEAYDNYQEKGTIRSMPDGKHRIKSVTNDGVEIIMYITKNAELKMAYPVVYKGV